MVARTVHSLSRRRNGPFVEVNCAAIPEELIESELFRARAQCVHRRGGRPARQVQMADGGTIFLDEIADMSLKTQAKGAARAPGTDDGAGGGTTRIKVDARVLAATNKDLQAEIRAGNFRKTSTSRLSVIPVFVPAAARASGKTFRSWPITSWRSSPAASTADARSASTTAPCHCCSTTRGLATSVNCAT